MSDRIPLWLLVVSWLVWLLFPQTVFAQSSDQLLQEAVQEYRAALDAKDRDQRLEKFHRAELLFARLVEGDRGDPSPNRDANNTAPIRNADLYVNLGNAALGAQRLGPAILAYRRALTLDPDHHRARKNLDHARTLLAQWVPRPEEKSVFDTFFSWGRRLSRAQLRTYAAVVFLIAAAFIALSIRLRLPLLRNLAILPAGLWLLLLAMLLFGASGPSVDAAVVVVPEVVARSADSRGAPARLSQPLPSGTEVRVIETRDQWSRVRLYDGRDAWLPTASIEFVERDDKA